jgi:hypothetical protein
VTAGLAVHASRADASLAAPREMDSGGPVVALGDVEVAGGVAVRWLDRPHVAGDASAGLVIAPAGRRASRHAPWPAADALFELPPPIDDIALVCGAETALREAIVERALSRGVEIQTVERIDHDALARCACVILAESPGGALPARAPAVLAAGRLLMVPRLETAFGVQDGLDHLEFADPDQAVTFVEAYRNSPEAFGRVTVWGRIAAEAQRASVVYGRLGVDMRLQAGCA